MPIFSCTFFIHLARFAWLCYGSDGVSHSFPVYCRFHQDVYAQGAVDSDDTTSLHPVAMASVLRAYLLQLSYSISWSSSPLSGTVLHLKKCLSVVSSYELPQSLSLLRGIFILLTAVCKYMIHLSRMCFEWVLFFIAAGPKFWEHQPLLAAFFFRGPHMRCMIVLISRIKLWIII